MANNSRSLKRAKLEPISMDELAGDSTMTGFSGLFNIPTAPVPQSPAPAPANSRKRRIDIVLLEKAGGAAPGLIEGLTSPPETGGAETGPPVSKRPPSYYPQPSTVTDPLDTDGLDTSPPVSAPLPRKLQIREARLVQEGHTYGEQTVYEALWKNGLIINDSIRLITIGFLRMASLAGLAESNCKAAVEGLVEKLALERLPGINLSQGRTYRVYSWTAVLARRRAAGLTHIIKSRGVVFVDPTTGRQMTRAKTLPRRPARESGGLETGGLETGGPVST